MTTTVAEQVAALLGDDVDRAHLVWHEGHAKVQGSRWVHSCLPTHEDKR